ncbi:MAG: GAF domain-containing protein [Anaerolineae bacterium]
MPRLLTRQAAVPLHLELADDPSEALSAFAGDTDILLCPAVTSTALDAWRRLFDVAAARSVPVVSVWPGSDPAGEPQPDAATALHQAIDRVQAGAPRDDGASHPEPADGVLTAGILGTRLACISPTAEPSENMTQYLGELATGLRDAVGSQVVELDLGGPSMRARDPEQAAIPPGALASAREMALATGHSVERELMRGNWLLVLPLRSPRRLHGTVALAGDSRSAPAAELVPTLWLWAGMVASGLDSAWLLREHRRSLDELQAISDIGRTMVASFSLDRILDTIVHTALRFIPGASRAVIHLPNDTRELLVPQAWAGEPLAPASLELPWGTGIAGKVATERRALYVPDASQHADYVAGSTAVGSLMVAPLLVGQAVIGTISVSSPEKNEFSDRATRVLTSLASQAAVAIENARLHGEARKADEVAALYELSQALNSSLDLQETITTILSSARSLTFASAAEVRLVSADGRVLEAVIALSSRPESAPGDRYRMSVFYPKLVLERLSPLLVEHTERFEQNDEFCRHEKPNWLHSYLGLPLVANQRPVGILSLGSDRHGAFTADDLRLLEIVAGQAATALSNARLYQEATKRLQEAEALAAVSRSAAASLDQRTLLSSVTSAVLKTAPLARYSFAYVVGDEGTPQLRAVAPSLTEEEHVARAGIWDWCADGCLVRSQPVYVEDTLRHGFPSLSASEAHSVMTVPMVAAGRLVGVLGVDSTLPNAFGPGDTRLMQAFADQAATGIESARLFEDLNRAYRDLAQSTETLSAVFHGITDGIYIVDAHDRLVMLNRPEADFVGRAPETLVGASYSGLYHRDDAPCEHCTVAEALATGSHQSQIVSLTEAGGRQIWREVDAYPITDREGIVNRVVVLTRDVTERRSMEANLFESSKLASIGQLATSIAHEVNNPLTVIVGNAEVLLLDLPADDEMRSTIEMILRAARRAARIVQNVLDLSSQRQYDMAEVDLETNLAEAVELVAYPLRKAGIEPTLAVDDGLPLLTASANHLKVVWMNLLLNARDAIVRAQRREGRVELRAGAAGDGTAYISVSDNGTGIGDEDRERLFQPFHTTKTAGQGLGLGLYNAYNIVKQHGGRIEVLSKLGEGSTFTVHLPLDCERPARESTL